MGSVPDPTGGSLVEALGLLAPTLSPAATVVRSGEDAYAERTARWSAKGAPRPGAVVNVASEADVEAVVRNTLVVASSR